MRLLRTALFIKYGFFSSLLGLTAFLAFSAVRAEPELISLFPLEHYNQSVFDWIKPGSPDYQKTLLSPEMQKQHQDTFYKHYFGSLSPWDPGYVNQIIHKAVPEDLKSVELHILNQFTNVNKPQNEIGFGENFHPYGPAWIQQISDNINLTQFSQLTYRAKDRAIAIDNLHARVLPTDEVYFYHYKLAGQGYPFDNLQMSAIWVGTPLYILTETQDHAWALVLTPEFIAWVKVSGLARASEAFINTWRTCAKKDLAAIIHSQTSLIDEAGQFQATAYVGAVFPAENIAPDFKLLIPSRDSQQQAEIKYAHLAADQAALMPLIASPQNFAQVISTLIGRPYGWGGLYFYNDCSAELKSLLTPFGIWLPRHSSDQVYAGRMIDMSGAGTEVRLAYLLEHGHPFLTLVYIGGHVFLYVGSFPNPNSSQHEAMALTYQNLWGLSPKPSTRRAIIGRAALFPLLLSYPEDSSLSSIAAKKYFQVAYLDQQPNYYLKLETIDLKALMSST